MTNPASEWRRMERRRSAFELDWGLLIHGCRSGFCARSRGYVGHDLERTRRGFTRRHASQHLILGTEYLRPPLVHDQQKIDACDRARPMRDHDHDAAARPHRQ